MRRDRDRYKHTCQCGCYKCVLHSWSKVKLISNVGLVMSMWTMEMSILSPSSRSELTNIDWKYFHRILSMKRDNKTEKIENSGLSRWTTYRPISATLSIFFSSLLHVTTEWFLMPKKIQWVWHFPHDCKIALVQHTKDDERTVDPYSYHRCMSKVLSLVPHCELSTCSLTESLFFLLLLIAVVNRRMGYCHE